MNYKYYVIVCSNGSIQLGEGQITEHTDLDAATVKYHQKCAALRNEKAVIEGYVEIVYTSNMEVVSVDGTTFKERITHPQETQQTTQNTESEDTGV